MSTGDLFTRFVQPGRLCLIHFGPNADKLAVIVDIIDQNRLLIDGPTTGVSRQQISIKHVQLTDFVVPGVQRGCGTTPLTRRLAEDKTVEKFQESPWGKKRAAQAFRANMTDFERFQLMVAHKRRQDLIKQTLKAQ